MVDAAEKVRGGQTVYTRQVADLICLRMENGETLRQICRDKDMPAASTVCLWVVDDRDGFAERYARAREGLLEHWAEEVVSIADDGSNDWMERETKSGNVVTKFDYEHALRSRLRVDTRKWLLSKLKPEKYGDKVQVDQTIYSKTLQDKPLDEAAWSANYEHKPNGHLNGHGSNGSTNGKG